MNNSLSLKTLFLGLVAAATLQAQDEWTVSLVQKHLESSGVFQGSVAREGSQVSFAPIPEGGSKFTLWAYRNGPSGLEEHLVDSETVGAYLPKGNLWITTPDPYSGGIPRTRIDQGFTVNFEVEGLMKGKGVPKAAKKVLLDHKVANATGDPKASSLGPEVEFDQSFISRNGLGAVKFKASNIPGSDPFNDSGMEVFRIFALPDGVIAELELSKAEVQIWPMSRATISGVSSKPYTIAPEVSVDLVNLYPDSETWVQVYPGSEKVGTNGTRLTESFALVKDSKPRDSVLRFTNLDSILLETGEWTLEVITRTPFGIERLAHTSINIDRNLALRGSFQALTDQ